MAKNTTLSRITEKRLEAELKMLRKDPLEFIDTYPDEKDKLIWYFLVRGADGTDYQGGFYIGKIMHHPEYPANPPDYMMYTPNGRFDTIKKICLTNSSYHKESWSAIWNIKSLLEAFFSIMAADDTNGISHIKAAPAERKKLAQESFDFNLKNYPEILAGFPRFVVVENDGSVKMKDSKEIDREYKEYLEKAKKKLKDKKSSKETKESKDDKDNKTLTVDNSKPKTTSTVNNLKTKENKESKTLTIEPKEAKKSLDKKKPKTDTTTKK